ncbi:MAG: tetratricopeptide repeat protein [Planctomycetota bacterium]
MIAALVLLGLASDGASFTAQEIPILERSPQEWPSVAPGEGPDRWSRWTVGASPPTELRPQLAQIVRAYDEGDLPATLKGLFAVLHEAPDFPPALHQAGLVYFQLQRYGDTVFALRRYLSVAPDRVGDTRHLAHALYSLGSYDEALAHYERVLAVHPLGLEARMGRGLTHMRLGKLEAALGDLDTVLRDDPQSADAAFWKARVHFDLDELEQAAASLDRAEELAPFDPRPAYLRAQIYYESGKDEEAAVAEARFTSLSKLAQEVRALEGRLLFNPRQPEVQRRLVQVHRASRNWQAAALALRRWLRLEPESVPIRVSMLEVAMEAGDESSAAVVAQSLRKRAGRSVLARAALLRYERQR